jgi:hypothetical protein
VPSGLTDRDRPVAPSSGRWRPLGLGEVTIDSGFWADLQQLNATAMIELYEARVERMGWIGNFDAAAEGRLPQDQRGREFSDSEIYKLLGASPGRSAASATAAMDAATAT